MMKNAVILSGFPGAGKSTLQKKLALDLGWSVYSVGEIYRERWQHEMTSISFEDWYRSRTVQDLVDINLECKQVLDLGSVVADGRYVVYAGSNVLRVFLTADIKTRSRRAEFSPKYEGKSVKEIADILKIRENDEVANGRTLFENPSIWKALVKNRSVPLFYDYRDPTNYDIVLNTSRIKMEEEFKIIKQLVASS